MTTTGPRGITAVAARFVAPTDVVHGLSSRLLGALYATGGVFVFVAMALGQFSDGWRAGLLGLASTAVLTGVGVYASGRHRVLSTATHVALTISGGLLMSLAVLWGGTSGGAALGAIYVYLTCFAMVALRRWAVALVLAGMTMHMGALLLSAQEDVVGLWVLTWGPAVVTSMLVGALVEWLQQSADRLRDADEHRTRFVATVSHELRTPLAAIMGSTETLQRHWDRLDAEQRWEIVEVIHRQAGRQLRLVNDVLAVTTRMAEAAPPAPEDVRLADVVERTAAEMKFPVVVDCGPDLHALVDPDHLRQIVENLLVNADRYGEPPVELRARADGESVVVAVVDHGPGLPGGLDSGLLEPFRQGDAGDQRSSAGVGLGLTICRDLVVANRGQLTYSDTPGGGATLHVVLPRGRHR